MIRSKGVKNLSATSIRKIRRMIAAVLAEPEFYNQNTFGEQLCKNDGQEICGTVCCAAGWAVWLDNRTLYERLMKKELKSDGWREVGWGDAALKALDLVSDNDVLCTLFGRASDWPNKFFQMYEDATTPKGRAVAFAKRWEHFIKMDAAE